MAAVGFEIGAYVLAAFLTFYGFVFLWIAKDIPPSPKRGAAAVVQGRVAFTLFAMLYLALAHFTVYVGLDYNIEFGNASPCEELVANSTFEGSTNITVYSYFNNCEALSVPGGTTSLFTIFSWILWIDILAMVLGGMMLFFRMISRW